jgi:hypothetical protein
MVEKLIAAGADPNVALMSGRNAADGGCNARQVSTR